MSLVTLGIPPYPLIALVMRLIPLVAGLLARLIDLALLVSAARCLSSCLPCSCLLIWFSLYSPFACLCDPRGHGSSGALALFFFHPWRLSGLGRCIRPFLTIIHTGHQAHPQRTDFDSAGRPCKRWGRQHLGTDPL